MSQTPNTRPRILFCGVGALGSAAAFACRNLEADLVFVDFDRVETKNLLAQAFTKQALGKNKADALRLSLQNFYGRKAESFGVRLTPDNVATLCDKAHLVIDCFDNAASRRLVIDHCRQKDIALLHGALAADGSCGLVRWDERFTVDEEDVPGQPTCEGGEHLPLIQLVAATLARATQDFITKRARWDALITPRGVALTYDDVEDPA